MVWLFDMRANWQITGCRAVTGQIHVVTRGSWRQGSPGGVGDGGWGKLKRTLALPAVA